MTSYADDTTLYVYGQNIRVIELSPIELFVKGFHLLFQWFNYNHMKANEDKCHIL